MLLGNKICVTEKIVKELKALIWFLVYPKIKASRKAS